MVKRNVEIEDTLSERLDDIKYELKELVIDYLNDNPDLDEAPDLFNDLDYDGRFHELIDSSVPIYTKEIDDLFYLYGWEFEKAFDDAGIGDKSDSGFPMGWRPAAIYCYLEQEAADWYEENKDDLYDEWKKDHPDGKDGEE